MRAPSLFALFLSLFSFKLAAAALEARGLLPSVDVCAYVNLNIYTALGLLDLLNQGKLNVCLCASTVRPYVQANVLLENVANILGEDAVVNLLLNVITNSGQNCMYPAHSMPICQQGAPCNFGCTDGYTKIGNTCVCPAPKIECNGMCQTQACSSTVPGKRSADSSSSSSKRSRMRILTDERCSRGQRLCGGGATRRSGVDDWECIDTRSTLDSCGGCIYHYILDDRPVEGADCSSLPGVSGVECRAGRCHVHRCKRGWKVAKDNAECVPDLDAPAAHAAVASRRV